MNELFPPEQVALKSPMMQWMEKHNLTTFDCLNGGECPETGTEFKRWCCFVGGDIQEAFQEAFKEGTIGEGDTRDEAVSNWAKINKVPLWNEQGFKP